MISLPETKENERLTDVAAIYMGGANYIKRGYYMYKSFRIGYLQEGESELVIREIERRYSLFRSVRQRESIHLLHREPVPAVHSACCR